MGNKLWEPLVLVFVPLSLVSVGGGPAVISEMLHQVVAVHGWMTKDRFDDLFAVSRVAPGAGSLLATLIGWQIAGWQGALIVSLAFFLPSSLLTYGAAYAWNRWQDSAWRDAIETGLAPISMGLILAGAYAILRSESNGLLAWAAAISVAVCRISWPKLHPVLLLGVGGVCFVLIQHLGLVVPHAR